MSGVSRLTLDLVDNHAVGNELDEDVLFGLVVRGWRAEEQNAARKAANR